MLNNFLPREILERSLKNYLDNIDWILKQIGTKNESILFDKHTLGLLHHSLSIDQYSKPQFRYQLLLHAPRGKLKKLLKLLQWNDQQIPVDNTEYKNFIKRLSYFQWGNNERTKAFVEALEYTNLLIPSEEINREGTRKIPKSDYPYRLLKDYQSKIFYDSSKLIEIPNQHFLIQMPTGAGKTRVAMEIVSFFLNNQENRQVLWLADREELCQQAVDTFMSTWPHVSKFELTLYGIWGTITFPSKFESHSFIVTTYQKIRNTIKEKNFFLRPDLIIVDEAHNVLAPTYQAIIEDLKNLDYKQTRLIGLSATPGRAYKDSKSNLRLAEFFNRQIIEIESKDQGVIEYLQDKRIISKVRRKPLDTKINYDLTKEEWNQLANDFDYPIQLLKRIANDQKRNLIITIQLLDLAKKNRQVLFFATSVEQSKMLCGLMIALNHPAAHIDGNTSSSYRRDVINKFRSGDIKFIFNYGIFAAGFDAPNIDTIFIARPTTSIVLYSQMIGRGLRGPEIGGTEELLLIDVIDKINAKGLALDNVYDFFSDYWR